LVYAEDEGSKMIRYLLINTFIVIHTIIFCLWGLLLSLFDKKGRIIHFYAAVPWAKVILWVCGVNVRVKGQENVNARVPRVYMTNHQSAIDIFALLAYLPVDFKFIMKQELMKIPLFGLTMRRAKHIGIVREDPRRAIQSMNEAIKRIKNGVSVLIFPEGTRSLDGELQPFKKGGFNLALRSGCDILPVAIRDSYRIILKGTLRINKGSFDMQIGKPISIEGYSRKNLTQLMDRVGEAIRNLMDRDGSDTKGMENRQQASDVLCKG
jgi:1-acyl-sn-glycerol-3-phosphate acyltransferase